MPKPISPVIWKRSEKGDVIGLCRHNKPVAEIRSLESPDLGEPEFGIYDGFGVSESFFEPLPGELINAFGGDEAAARYLRCVMADDGIEKGLAVLRNILTNPANGRYLSAASVWEIVVKWQAGKLKLPKPPGEFFAAIKSQRQDAILAD